MYTISLLINTFCSHSSFYKFQTSTWLCKFGCNSIQILLPLPKMTRKLCKVIGCYWFLQPVLLNITSEFSCIIIHDLFWVAQIRGVSRSPKKTPNSPFNTLSWYWFGRRGEGGDKTRQKSNKLTLLCADFLGFLFPGSYTFDRLPLTDSRNRSHNFLYLV